MILSEELRSLVRGFEPAPDPRSMRGWAATLALLERAGDVCARTGFDPGHITASGLVLSRDGAAVLLVLHERLGRWLQPGGHVEPSDASAAEAARREIREETGVEVDPGVEPVLVAVDVHEIPAARGEPAHLHHDLMFRFVVREPEGAPVRGSHHATWVPVERLEDFGVDDPVRLAVRRARGMAPFGGSPR